MKVNRAYLAAIEGHNWEPGGVEYTRVPTKLIVPMGIEPKGRSIREQAELIECIHSESAEPIRP